MRLRKNHPKYHIFWPILWVVIFISFVALDIFWPGSIISTILKVEGIFFCLVFSWWYARADKFLILALIFTVCADLILAIYNYSPIGVFVFVFAELTHFIRLNENAKFARIYIICALIALIVGAAITWRIYIFGFVYGITLIINFIYALKWHRRSKGNSFPARTAFWGFILLICCDICAALSFLASSGGLSAFGITILSASIIPFVDVLAWVFYYPSQILISTSSKVVLQ